MNKRFKKSVTVLLIFSIFIVSIFYNKTEVEAAKPKINKTKISIEKGKSYTLKINNTSKKVKWSTNNKKIATVSSKGKVIGKNKGTVTITAKIGKTKYTCKVTVKDIPNISFNIDELILTKGSTFKQILKNKESFILKGVKWSSSNKKIATVSSSGNIKAKKSGSVKITAIYKNKKYSFNLKVIDNNIIYENKQVKVSLKYLYSYPSTKYDYFLNRDFIQLQIKNKTSKSITFVTTNLSINKLEVASNRFETTKISPNSESYNYSFLFDKSINFNTAKTISGSMGIVENNKITQTIEFDNFKIQ